MKTSLPLSITGALLLAACSGTTPSGSSGTTTAKTTAATGTSAATSATGATGSTSSATGAASTTGSTTATSTTGSTTATSTTGSTIGGTSTTSSTSTTGSTIGGTSTTGSTTATSTTGSTTATSTTGSTGTSGAPALRFAFTGDTRPANCDDIAGYPKPVMDSIVASLQTRNVAFAIDSGDHLKICKATDTTQQGVDSANQQLQLYASAVQALGKPFYLTMGNHECWDNKNLCDVTDAILGAFMSYVQQAVPGATQPYYTFDVQTAHGTATIISVADTAWDATQAAWLEQALTHGDASTYTIIAKHVPSSNTTDFPTNADEMTIIGQHKFALLVDAHAHVYSHAGLGGREVTLGLGGAPLSNPSVDDFGYGLVEEQADGTLKVSIVVASSNNVRDSFILQPN